MGYSTRPRCTLCDVSAHTSIMKLTAIAHTDGSQKMWLLLCKIAEILCIPMAGCMQVSALFSLVIRPAMVVSMTCGS